jgi:hypothetical protein
VAAAEEGATIVGAPDRAVHRLGSEASSSLKSLLKSLSRSYGLKIRVVTVVGDGGSRYGRLPDIALQLTSDETVVARQRATSLHWAARG